MSTAATPLPATPPTAAAGERHDTVRLVSVTEDDRPELDAIAALMREYVETATVPREKYGFRWEEIDTLPGPYQTRHGGLLLLAVREGEPLGCVGFKRLEDGTCELKRLYVSPSARGLGLGERLVRESERQAAAMGYDRMVLDSYYEFEAARQLYLRLGFVDIPPYNDHVAENIYHMGRVLAG